MIRDTVYLAALIALMTVGLSQLTQGQEVQIIDYGIYTGRVEKILNEPNSPTGQARTIWTDLVKQTNIIPAVLNTKFGFRFKVFGLSEKTTARLRFKFTFPEMKNPTSGKTTSSYEAIGDIPVAPKEQGMFWDFVHPWEMCPGEWTASLYSGDRLVAQKIFTVVGDQRSGVGKRESDQKNSEPEPADRFRRKTIISGGWLRSLTSTLYITMKSYFLAPISSRNVATAALQAVLPETGDRWLLKGSDGDVIAYFSLIENDDTTGLRTVQADISGRH